MRVVYKAQDLKPERPVVLNSFLREPTRVPDAMQHFVREAKTASSLQHNNICVF